MAELADVLDCGGVATVDGYMRYSERLCSL